MDDRSTNIGLGLLMFLLCLGVVVFYVVYFFHFSSYDDDDDDDDGNSCNSTACKTLRDDLLTHMHRASNPCKDFYEFCCGRFLSTATIPRGFMFTNAFQKLDEKLNQRLHEILTGPYHEDTPLYEVFLKKYFKSCINLDSIEKSGMKPILDLLQEFGGWPMIDDSFDEDKVNLTFLLIKLKTYQIKGFFYLALSRDDENDQKESIFIVQARPSLSKGYYSKPVMREALRRHILEVAHLLSGKVEAELNEDIEELVDFEKNISSILIPLSLKVFLPLKDIAKHVLVQIFNESFSFDHLIRQLYTELEIAPRKNVTFLSYDFNFLYELSRLLERSSKSTIVNYLLWELLKSLMLALPDPFVQSMTKFRKATETFYELPKRSLTCLHLVEELDYLYSATYKRKYFTKSSKDKVLELVKYLKESYKTLINGVAWMTRETKAKAIEKLLSTREDIGYPDFLDNPKFNDLFKKEFVELNNFLEYLFFSRTLSARVSLAAPMISMINDEIGSVAKLNAYYNYFTHAIEIPAGMLQWPFFSETSPMYFNFGGIGHVIGHELSHAFDKKGGMTDEFGNLISWWTKKDLDEFAKASQCLVKQYGGFTVNEIQFNIDGLFTLKENVADDGGIKGSFLAYKNWVKTNGPEQKLPGLPYTPEQLFFIAFGRIFCAKANPKYLLKDLMTNTHAQERFRVNGPLMNLKEFSEVFKCPVGSPMNPARKCKVW